MPTWNLRDRKRQSLRAAGVAAAIKVIGVIAVGATRFAMMGDQSPGKAWNKFFNNSTQRFQAAMAKLMRSIFFSGLLTVSP